MKRRAHVKRDELRPEYTFDYSKAVHGKYLQRLLEEGANVVVLEPKVAKVFRGSAAVNDALRALLQITEITQRITKRATSTGRQRRGLTVSMKINREAP